MSSSAHKISRIIFDFDNTVFDTEALKDVFWHMGSIHGYSFEQSQNIYHEARSQGNTITMAVGSYITKLKEHCQKDKKEFQNKKIENIMAKLPRSQRLLPGAKELLGFCKKKLIERYLLTLGVPAWQEEKVKRSGIDVYFEPSRIVYTRDINMGKIKALRKLFGKSFQGEGTIFFNDKPDESEQLLHTFPSLIMFVRREVRDSRFTEKDFKALRKKFPHAVFWSENLVDLLVHLKRFIA